MAVNNPIVNFTFHNKTTNIGDGKIFNVDGKSDTVNLEFITNGTFTAKLMAQVIDETKWYPYECFKKPTFDLITDTITDSNYIYGVDITGISKLKVVVTAVSGELTVLGKAVG